jgi:hypothetical protein
MSWLPKQTVVVPIDFSDESDAAVEMSLELVAAAAGIHLIHVLPVLAATEVGLVWDTVTDDARREQTEKAIRERFAGEQYEGLNIVVKLATRAAKSPAMPSRYTRT